MSGISVMVGRALLGLYFLLPGIQKFTASERMVAYMQSHEVPYAPYLLWFAGAVSIIGGLMLITGRHVKLVAYGFVVYVLMVNFMLHDFWTMTGDNVGHETQNFVKNLAIAAGLLALAGHATSRRISTENWWHSDKSVSNRFFS